jgi:hypothetical protein
MLRPVDLGLNQAEVEFILDGFDQWGGPAGPQPESAQLMGFRSADDMASSLNGMRDALAAGEAMSRRAWKRALIATELLFGSDTFGAGVEWETVTGRNDVEDLRLLRGIQRKLVGVCPPPPSD